MINIMCASICLVLAVLMLIMDIFLTHDNDIYASFAYFVACLNWLMCSVEIHAIKRA